MVEVDDDFARFGDKSYAINKITSVEIRRKKGDGAGCAVFLFLVAGICLMVALFSIQEGPFVPLLFGAVASAIGYGILMESKKIEYQLYLITTASEAQAYKSRDESEVLALRKQIETAMARRR